MKAMKAAKISKTISEAASLVILLIKRMSIFLSVLIKMLQYVVTLEKQSILSKESLDQVREAFLYELNS
jgi:hypothetical protein